MKKHKLGKKKKEFTYTKLKLWGTKKREKGLIVFYF